MKRFVKETLLQRRNGKGMGRDPFKRGGKGAGAKALGVRRRATRTAPQGAFDRAGFNTELSETVLGFSPARTCFPPEPWNKYLEGQRSVHSSPTCLFVWTHGCSIVKAI